MLLKIKSLRVAQERFVVVIGDIFWERYWALSICLRLRDCLILCPLIRCSLFRLGCFLRPYLCRIVWEKLQDELPVESDKGLREGAVGLIAVQGLIINGDFGKVSELKEPNDQYNQWKIDTAKAIRGSLKNLGAPVSRSELSNVVEKFVRGEVALSALIKEYGVKAGTFDNVDGVDNAEKALSIRQEIQQSDNPDTAAYLLVNNILAYNLINSGEYADIVNVSADEAGTTLSQSWYTAGSGGVVNAVGGGLQGIYNEFIADEEQSEEYKQTLEARRQSILDGKSEKEVAGLSEEQQISNVKFHLQTLIASKMGRLATLSEWERSYSVDRYRKTYMMQSPPSEIVNKLTYVPGSEEFTNITVPQASSLIPMIRLYKIIYDEKGQQEEMVPIVFNSYTKTEDVESSGLAGLGRSGVGIKSFDWQYNGTNIATTKNDITAKLVLYFQNFNDLLKIQPNGFKYVDLLIRTAPGQTKNSDKPIEDPCAPDTSSPEIDIADPRHFEIKAVVGWAPNLDYARRLNLDGLATGIQGQKVPLFLTLVEHEFSVQQDGTFELSINYRGRIDGLMMDKRADIILTPETRRELCLLQEELEEAQDGCHDTDIEKIKHEIKLVKQGARNKSGMHFTVDGLLKGDKVYCLELEKETFDAAGGLIYNLTSDDIIGIKNLKLLSSTSPTAYEDNINDASNKLNEANEAVNVGGCHNEWLESFAASAGEELTDGFNASDLLNGPALTLGLAQETGFTDYIFENYLGEVNATDDATKYDCFLRGYHEAKGETAPGDTITDVAEGQVSENFNTFGLSEDNGRVIVPYFFFGDLVDIAADFALGRDKYTTSEGSCGGDLHPNRVDNMGIILGTMFLEPLGEDKEGKVINIGDIPIALPYFRDWWHRNVNKSKANTYPLVRFIRECLKDFVIDAVGGEVLDGRRPQRLLMKDASISVPAMSSGASPIEDKIQTNPYKPTRPAGDQDRDEGSYNQGKLIASRLNGSSINNQYPLTPVNPPNLTPNEMFHYKVFYLVNQVPTDLNGDRFEDNRRGIQHLVMGAENGILKDAQFKRSTVKGLREQRVVEESELNPLKHLADVYNITARTIGNVIFYPGQLLYLNPIGFGSKLGLPTNPMSPSRAMGIGGYHLVTQVSSFIENGKFETTIEALFETSGGPKAKRADNGRETDSTKCENGNVGETSKDIENDINQPETGAST